MQAVPLATIGAAPGPAPRAVFDWQERSGSLFAAGGAQPLVVHRWDLCQELCTQQVRDPRIPHLYRPGISAIQGKPNYALGNATHGQLLRYPWRLLQIGGAWLLACLNVHRLGALLVNVSGGEGCRA